MSVAVVEDLRIALGRGEGALALVDGVSLAVEAGTVLGVLGETGAGKTLTVKALLGLLPEGMRVEGRVEVAGRPVSYPAAGTGTLDAGVVLQNPAGMLDPLMRVGDQLFEAVVYHRRATRAQARERAERLIGQMGFDQIADVLRSYPHQLSGGMAQRVAIAMALTPSPRLLVVDEPTSALDANLRVEILGLLKQVAVEHGTAVVMVSHDLALVARFCDVVAVMYAGRVVERGPVEAVMGEPAHPYTAALLETAPSTAAQAREPLAVIPGTPTAPGSWPSGCVFRTRCRLAFERCERVRPLLPETAHAAACHLAGEDR